MTEHSSHSPAGAPARGPRSLIFEMGSPESRCIEPPDLDVPAGSLDEMLGGRAAHLRAAAPARDRGRDRAALRPSRVDELRRRHGLVSARLVHDEVQPAPERGRVPPRRLRRPAPVPARRDRPRRARADGRPVRGPRGDLRTAGRHAAARGGRARRAHGAHGLPGLPRGGGRPPATGRHPRRRARHESGDRRDVRLRGHDDPERRRRAGSTSDALRAALDTDVAALMLTNPNTLGLFDPNITEITDAVHAVGALAYCDGANLNAIMGKARPGDMGFDAHAHQPAQDVLDPARRRRPRFGSGVRHRRPRAVPARPVTGPPRGRQLLAWAGPIARSAACAASTATSACSCGPTPTSSRSAGRASRRRASRRCCRRTTSRRG